MLDRFKEYRDLASKSGYDNSLTEDLFRYDEESLEKDRQLISLFMVKAKLVLQDLSDIETNNQEMKRIYHQQVNENKRADGESKQFLWQHRV